jgi:predicted DCC family thiol-disulfide oxidoreductase YuxK
MTPTLSTTPSLPTLTVFYDGACRVCSREIAMYQRAKGSENILFVDICAASFDAQKENLDPFEVHRSFHVRAADGTLFKGVEGFVKIWDTLPGFHWMAKASRLPGMRPLMNVGYRVFTVVRPYLPRKKFDCDGSPYCEIPRKKESPT